MKLTPSQCSQNLRSLAGLTFELKDMQTLTESAAYLESLGDLVAASQKMAAAFEELLDKYTKLAAS